jgi:hypothetical protein
MCKTFNTKETSFFLLTSALHTTVQSLAVHMPFVWDEPQNGRLAMLGFRSK